MATNSGEFLIANGDEQCVADEISKISRDKNIKKDQLYELFKKAEKAKLSKIGTSYSRLELMAKDLNITIVREFESKEKLLVKDNAQNMGIIKTNGTFSHWRKHWVENASFYPTESFASEGWIVKEQMRF